MHPIIATFLGQFSREHAIEALDEADQFERFVNFCIVSNRCPTRFDVEDVTTEDPEVGIDGVAVIIGDVLVATSNEARLLFDKRQRDVDVKYTFVQSKRSDSFSRTAMLNLRSAVRDVLADAPQLPRDAKLKEAAEIHKVVIENVNKVRNGQPNCSLVYVSTGEWQADRVLEATREQVIRDIRGTRFFREVTFEPLGFDDLRREWIATRSPSEAKFAVLGELPMPAMEGVSEALIVLVSAGEFVRSVLRDDKGRLRANVFEQNVRHFLGEQNEVNEQIRSTIDDAHKKHRFAILNNGITIVAREIRRIANTVTVKDFQIVNGCQTSHVLHHNYHSLDNDVVLVLKAISALEGNVVDEVVVATNSQTKVAESQFLAIKDEVRAIQQFFARYPGGDGDDRRLFFERRIGEFADKEIPTVRIFDIHLLAKVFASMFLDAPHDALGSPSRVYDLPQLFGRSGLEIAYYTAAFAYYRLVLMVGNKQISRNDGILKWHVLTAMRYQLLGGLPLGAKPGAMEKECRRLLEMIWQPPKDSVVVFQRAVALVKSVPRTSDQELRAKPFTDKLIAAAVAGNKAVAKPSARGRASSAAKRKQAGASRHTVKATVRRNGKGAAATRRMTKRK